MIRTLFSLIRKHCRMRVPSFRVNSYKYFVSCTIYVQNQVNERIFSSIHCDDDILSVQGEQRRFVYGNVEHIINLNLCA